MLLPSGQGILLLPRSIDNTQGETIEPTAKTCQMVTDGHTSHSYFSEIFQEHIACCKKPEQAKNIFLGFTFSFPTLNVLFWVHTI